MAINIISRQIVLDVYRHDGTLITINAIATDNDTRYVAAEIQNDGARYDIGSTATVELMVLRPDKIGVGITGEPYAFTEEAPGSYNPETEEYTPGETVTYYGVYAELDQAALAKTGSLLGQFKITSGEQVLHTNLFKINNGRALETETSDWSGEYQGYNLDELVQTVNTAAADVDNLKEGLSEYVVIEKISDMSGVEKDHVLVLHNDSVYGDGGPCWFEVMENVTENGYARKDGKKMCPMLDQAPLLTSDPPVEKMMGFMASYIENGALQYGNDHTLFDETTTNEIDCSSFISAVLNGISYSSSKYVTGTSTRRMAKIASYAPSKTNIFGHLKSRRMAQYFAEHKWLHSMPTVYQMRNVLQFGDILFSGSGASEAENRYLKIDHVSIVLGILNNTYVIVAQCGTYPSAVTIKDNSNTVGKISTIALSSANISTYFKAFARIPYINEHEQIVMGNKIKPIFIPDIFVDDSRSGELSSSAVCATSYGFIGVLPESVLTFTGATSHNGNSLTALVVEYDGKFQYLSKTNFTINPKTLSASTRYIRLCYSHQAGSDVPMLLDDCEQFEATIS